MTASPGPSEAGRHSGRPEPGAAQPEVAAGDRRAEEVLSQALRALAGGAKQAPGSTAHPLPGGVSTGRSSRLRQPVSQLQMLLIAIIVGLLIGIAFGLLSLRGLILG